MDVNSYGLQNPNKIYHCMCLTKNLKETNH